MKQTVKTFALTSRRYENQSINHCLPNVGVGSLRAGAPPVDMDMAATEVSRCYGKAHPEVQEFVLQTARSFGTGGM